MQASSSDDYDLQIIITSGTRNLESVIAGLAIALAAAIAGNKIVVFLTMEGAAFANPEEGKINTIQGFESVQRYIDLLLNENSRIEACASCVNNYCFTKSINGKKIIRDGLHYSGLSTAAIRATRIKTLIF